MSSTIECISDENVENLPPSTLQCTDIASSKETNSSKIKHTDYLKQRGRRKKWWYFNRGLQPISELAEIKDDPLAECDPINEDTINTRNYCLNIKNDSLNIINDSSSDNSIICSENINIPQSKESYSPCLKVIEKFQEIVLDSAVRVIQAAFKRFRERRRFLKIKKAVVVIQRNLRKWLQAKHPCLRPAEFEWQSSDGSKSDEYRESEERDEDLTDQDDNALESDNFMQDTHMPEHELTFDNIKLQETEQSSLDEISQKSVLELETCEENLQAHCSESDIQAGMFQNGDEVIEQSSFHEISQKSLLELETCEENLQAHCSESDIQAGMFQNGDEVIEQSSLDEISQKSLLELETCEENLQAHCLESDIQAGMFQNGDEVIEQSSLDEISQKSLLELETCEENLQAHCLESDIQAGMFQNGDEVMESTERNMNTSDPMDGDICLDDIDEGCKTAKLDKLSPNGNEMQENVNCDEENTSQKTIDTLELEEYQTYELLQNDNKYTQNDGNHVDKDTLTESSIKDITESSESEYDASTNETHILMSCTQEAFQISLHSQEHKEKEQLKPLDAVAENTSEKSAAKHPVEIDENQRDELQSDDVLLTVSNEAPVVELNTNNHNNEYNMNDKDNNLNAKNMEHEWIKHETDSGLRLESKDTARMQKLSEETDQISDMDSKQEAISFIKE